MDESYLQMPQSSIIDLLKLIPRNKIIEIFDAVMVSYDDSPLTQSEIKNIDIAKKEKKGELIDWEIIR